ncbi:MAG: hypothetical protein ACJ79W_14905, partial [Myxococcales bacterium]
MTDSTQHAATLDLKDFFSAAEARTDRWRQINAAARAWEAAVAQGKLDDRLPAEARRLLGEVAPLEGYWAYPGPRLMTLVGETLEGGNAAVFARLVQRISASLLSGSYRHDSVAWDPLDEAEARLGDVLPPDLQGGNGHRPYFEVLVVTPNDPATWERARTALRRLRRAEDPFTYEIVQTASFEDGVVGAIFNTNVQAVVLYDGFQFRSRHDLPVMREFLFRHLRVDPASLAPGALATTLARAVKNYRPELDLYLLTDRAVEQLAGSAEAAPIRRIFHDVEELMELHLAIVDGVNDRYDTPFFNNLKQY